MGSNPVWRTTSFRNDTMFDWLRKKNKDVAVPTIPVVKKTIIQLVKTKVPACIWEAEVHYDLWGRPYIMGWGDGPSTRRHDETRITTIADNGITGVTWLHGTVWKHKSGPAVTFGNEPKDPFK